VLSKELAKHGGRALLFGEVARRQIKLAKLFVALKAPSHNWSRKRDEALNVLRVRRAEQNGYVSLVVSLFRT
jgi:hypothetical protein